MVKRRWTRIHSSQSPLRFRSDVLFQASSSLEAAKCSCGAYCSQNCIQCDQVSDDRSVGLQAEQNSDGYHGWMYFDIVLRYQLLVLITSFSLPAPPKPLYIGSQVTTHKIHSRKEWWSTRWTLHANIQLGANQSWVTHVG